MNVDTLLIDLPTAPWQLPAFTDRAFISWRPRGCWPCLSANAPRW